MQDMLLTIATNWSSLSVSTVQTQLTVPIPTVLFSVLVVHLVNELENTAFHKLSSKIFKARTV